MRLKSIHNEMLHNLSDIHNRYILLCSLTDTWDRRRLPSLGELGAGRQPVVATSKLPGKGAWKQRTNLVASELVAAVTSRSDQSGIPTRKYSAVTMSSTLPRRSHIGSSSIASKT